MGDDRQRNDLLRWVSDGTSADEFAWDWAAEVPFEKPSQLRARIFRLLLASVALHLLAEYPENARQRGVRDLARFIAATPPGRIERELKRSRSGEARLRACRVWHRGADHSVVRSELAHMRVVLYTAAVDDS